MTCKNEKANAFICIDAILYKKKCFIKESGNLNVTKH